MSERADYARRARPRAIVYDLADGPARKRFERWFAAATPGPLLETVIDRRWCDDDPSPAEQGYRRGFRSYFLVYWRLAPPDVARVRAAAITAIAAAGGRVELGATVATVVAGELRISMA